tara:strand:- start:1259 stop:1372 length:114 start_codon:yes stop_codon:yes gene_type:complete
MLDEKEVEDLLEFFHDDSSDELGFIDRKKIKNMYVAS